MKPIKIDQEKQAILLKKQKEMQKLEKEEFLEKLEKSNIRLLNRAQRLKAPIVKGRTFTKPSLTVPDQTLSIRTILDRHRRGVPTGTTTREGFYTGNTEVPQIQDINDIEEFKQANKARQLDLEEVIKDIKEEERLQAIHLAKKIADKTPPIESDQTDEEIKEQNEKLAKDQ